MTHTATLTSGERIVVEAPTKEEARRGITTAIAAHPNVRCHGSGCRMTGTERIRRLTAIQHPKDLPAVVVSSTGAIYF